ncbi:hypothetical protein H9P43_006147 [Blastocladiella emersonii ATCC 22665]|nr:hypothetical protein H9P43_006147 [Blastocladiella emersonii ATCC 22665]
MYLCSALRSAAVRRAATTAATSSAFPPRLILAARRPYSTADIPTIDLNATSAPSGQGFASFPSHYLQNTTVLDTRDLNRVDDAELAESTTATVMQLNDWATRRRAAALSVEVPQADGSALAAAEKDAELGPLLYSLHHTMLANARCGRYEIVEKLFELAAAAELPLETPLHNDRLLALCRSRVPENLDRALSYYHDLKRSGTANEHTLAVMVDGLAKHGRVRRGLELLEEWEADARSSNGKLTVPQPAFTSLIAAFLRQRDPDAAWKLFHRMQLHHTLPDEVTYSAMIRACAVTGEVEKALSLFDTLRASHLVPTTTTINSLLHAMSKRRDYAPQALDLYAQSRAAGFGPDDRSMAYLMACARRAQDWSTVGAAIWAEAQQRGLVTDAVVAQALWTVSVEQVRRGTAMPEAVATILDGVDIASRAAESADLANAFLATQFPFAGDRGLKWFFDFMPAKNGMSFRLALSYCMDDPVAPAAAGESEESLDVVSSQTNPILYHPDSIARRARGVEVWAAWEAWYADLQRSCEAHVAAVTAADAGGKQAASAAEHAYLAQHTMTRPVLYKLVCVAVNGIAVDYPRKALALLLKYCKDHGVRIDPKDFGKLDWHVRHMAAQEDPMAVPRWDAMLEAYGVKKSGLEKSLAKLRNKWSRVRK